METKEQKKPGDEVAPGTAQSGDNVCPRCGGSGRVERERCPACDGSGKVTTLVGDA